MPRKKILRKDKKLHRDFVWLAASEYEHLCQLLGTGPTERWIDELNLYLGSKGDPYESHYYTIQVWARRKAKADAETRGHGDAGKDKAAADRVIEALKDKHAPLPAKDLNIRNALFAMLTKQRSNWLRLRARLQENPTQEERIREEFILEYKA